MNKPIVSCEDPALAEEALFAAVCLRDRAFDGQVVYAVRSTGIYCRPSCPSRRPQLKNVAFYLNPEDAEAAGFRACKRCRPHEDDKASAIIAAACRRLDIAEDAPALADLAHQAGFSPAHFQKVFKAALGVSPSAYFRARRADKARAALQAGGGVTEAIYESGFKSSGRFYEASCAMLGMIPSAYRQGGKGERITFAIGQSALGAVLAASTERGVCAILLGDDPEGLAEDLQRRFSHAELIGGDAAYEQILARVAALVEQPAKAFDLPLDIRGTAFQMRVWAALRQIPAGGVADYAEIARRIGAPKAARAVARACAANPLAIAIPCHRVVRRDGHLSGYRWGLERKRDLLNLELASVESAPS